MRDSLEGEHGEGEGEEGGTWGGARWTALGFLFKKENLVCAQGPLTLLGLVTVYKSCRCVSVVLQMVVKGNKLVGRQV